ncbi:MAG: hypothetical protein ACC628_14130, partial [Pirellulaceae bacterium]
HGNRGGGAYHGGLGACLKEITAVYYNTSGKEQELVAGSVGGSVVLFYWEQRKRHTLAEHGLVLRHAAQLTIKR